MTNPPDLKKLFAGISLAVLAMGFTLLGLLALTNSHPEDQGGAGPGENRLCLIGSGLSIFAGGIFLIAGGIYWTRSTGLAITQPQNKHLNSP